MYLSILNVKIFHKYGPYFQFGAPCCFRNSSNEFSFFKANIDNASAKRHEIVWLNTICSLQIVQRHSACCRRVHHQRGAGQQHRQAKHHQTVFHFCHVHSSVSFFGQPTPAPPSPPDICPFNTDILPPRETCQLARKFDHRLVLLVFWGLFCAVLISF